MENYRACVENNFEVLNFFIKIVAPLLNLTVNDISSYKCAKENQLTNYNKYYNVKFIYILPKVFMLLQKIQYF